MAALAHALPQKMARTLYALQVEGASKNLWTEMSREKFEQGCPGCRVAILDVKTRRPLPETHPSVRAMQSVLDAASLQEKEAWHRFTCQNSRAPIDLCIVQDLKERFMQAMRELN